MGDVEELAESIREFGLQQPISVQPQPDATYLILGGHRRVAAYRRNKVQYPDDLDERGLPRWDTITATIGYIQPNDADDPLRSMLTLVSQQLHTNQWSPREEAAAYDQLHHQYNMGVRDIATAIRKSAASISKRRRVYQVPDISEAVQAGQLTPGVAEELLVVTSDNARNQLLKRAIDEKWSQAQARAAARALAPSRLVKAAVRLADELGELLEQLYPDDLNAAQQGRLWKLRDSITELARKSPRGVKKRPIIPNMEAVARTVKVRKQVTK